MPSYFTYVVKRHLKSVTWQLSIVFVRGYELVEYTLYGWQKEKHAITAGLNFQHLKKHITYM